MWSGLFWQKWRRTLPVLLFLTRYYIRILLLELRYRVRNLPREEIANQAHEHWRRLCQALTSKTALRHTRERLESETLTGTLRAIRQNLEHERLHLTLVRARRKLEQLVFVEERPTQPLRVSFPKTGALLRPVPEKRGTVQRCLHTLKTGEKPAPLLAGLASLLLVALFAASGLPGQALRTMQHLGISSVSRLLTSELSIKAHQISSVNASQALVRISQLDESEYASQTEYDTWAYSACSTTSMTEVLNAYGYHYRITDVLQVEARLGEITPQLGLVENAGIANTAARFGFQTDWGNHWTLAQVISIANLGRPVIVSWPPQRYDGGHLVVVTGGDADNIYLADSSRWNRHALTRAQFLQWWDGFAAVMIPG